jgi:flagellar P-ring protein precursor FlgI
MAPTRIFAVFLAVAGVLAAMPAGASRVKDLASFEGIRENHLVGYGLVVGLSGTGDNLNNSPMTLQSLQAMLERQGVNISDTIVKSKNVAAVMVTSKISPFSRQGTTLDVTVSALGDSKSLTGGTLIATELKGADQNVYAIAQGPVVTSGFQAAGQGAKVQQGIQTTAAVPGGAIVEQEIPFALDNLDIVRLALRAPDLTTASRIEDAVNRKLGAGSAVMTDPGTIRVRVPQATSVGSTARMLASIEQIEVDADQVAKVVVDERSGTLVIGDKVRVSAVAVSQGGLTVRITENPVAVQPDSFSRGETVVLPRTDIEIQQTGTGTVAVLPAGTTLGDLVRGLNALGVAPKEMAAILRSIKAAGALHAELEFI